MSEPFTDWKWDNRGRVFYAEGQPLVDPKRMLLRLEKYQSTIATKDKRIKELEEKGRNLESDLEDYRHIVKQRKSRIEALEKSLRNETGKRKSIEEQNEKFRKRIEEQKANYVNSGIAYQGRIVALQSRLERMEGAIKNSITALGNGDHAMVWELLTEALTPDTSAGEKEK